MSFNSLLEDLESAMVFLCSFFIFLATPIGSLGILVLYAAFRDKFVSLICFSFLYDILYGDKYLWYPKATLISLGIILIIYLVKNKLLKMVRKKKVIYDF